MSGGRSAKIPVCKSCKHLEYIFCRRDVSCWRGHVQIEHELVIHFFLLHSSAESAGHDPAWGVSNQI